MQTKLAQALALLQRAQRIVAFSGAGISTEAGIPDFRSEGGLWENAELLELLSSQGFRRDPAGFYRAAVQLLPGLAAARPTAAHELLARLEEAGKLTCVVTQNIDGLHQAAGSRVVHEIHGSLRTGRCTACGARYEMAGFYEEIERGRLDFPRCEVCGAALKPEVVLFGDLLPFDVWERAVQAVTECDLLLVLGSSLVVYPAAELPQVAAAHGAKVVIVNREATDYDALATAAVHCELGDFARAALQNMKG